MRNMNQREKDIAASVARLIADVRRETREATIRECAEVARGEWECHPDVERAILALLSLPSPPAAEPHCRWCAEVAAKLEPPATEPLTHSELMASAERAAAEVATWPEWKRKAAADFLPLGEPAESKCPTCGDRFTDAHGRECDEGPGHG